MSGTKFLRCVRSKIVIKRKLCSITALVANMLTLLTFAVSFVSVCSLPFIETMFDSAINNNDHSFREINVHSSLS